MTSEIIMEGFLKYHNVVTLALKRQNIHLATCEKLQRHTREEVLVVERELGRGVSRAVAGERDAILWL